MLCGSLDGRGVWGRVDTCICMVESLCCPPETDTILLLGGEESRWRRNRTGRSLSLLQIHRKNNRTVKKVYKTTSDH